MFLYTFSVISFGLSFLFCQNAVSGLKYVGAYSKFLNIPKQGCTNFRNIWEPNQIFVCDTKPPKPHKY
jgi:hypothetical protein